MTRQLGGHGVIDVDELYCGRVGIIMRVRDPAPGRTDRRDNAEATRQHNTTEGHNACGACGAQIEILGDKKLELFDFHGETLNEGPLRLNETKPSIIEHLCRYCKELRQLLGFSRNIFSIHRFIPAGLDPDAAPPSHCAQRADSGHRPT